MVYFFTMNNKPRNSSSLGTINIQLGGNSSEESQTKITEMQNFDKPITIYSKKFFESIQCKEKLFYNNKKAALYKTEMCRSFSEMGFCKYGDSCQFCHSESELRKIERHPKYKTEICRTFWLEGSCPYGRRCCFAHRENVNSIRKNKVKNNINPIKVSQTLENASLSSFAMEIDDSRFCDGDTFSIEQSGDTVFETRCPVMNREAVGKKTDEPEICKEKHVIEMLNKESPCETGKHVPPNKNFFFWKAVSDNPKNIFCNDRQKHYFTFNRYYKGDFEPILPTKENVEYKSIWEDNAMNIWADEPLFFITKTNIPRK